MLHANDGSSHAAKPQVAKVGIMEQSGIENLVTLTRALDCCLMNSQSFPRLFEILLIQGLFQGRGMRLYIIVSILQISYNKLTKGEGRSNASKFHTLYAKIVRVGRSAAPKPHVLTNSYMNTIFCHFPEYKFWHLFCCFFICFYFFHHFKGTKICKLYEMAKIFTSENKLNKQTRSDSLHWN